MADKKISALTSLAQGDVAASTDVLPIVDTSATETKKITASALVGAGMTAGVTNVDINSGAIDGTTIGANSAAAGTFTNLTASGTVSFSGATVSNGGAVTTIDINGGTIDATSIGASSASTGAFTTLTTSSTVTLNGGTANGVLYLNGSKVATSGSALTFDGTILTTARFNVTNTTNGATFNSSGGSGMRLYGSSGTNQWDIYLNSTNLRFSDNTGGGQLFVDTGAYFGGNVGIGTSSPGAKLSVDSGTTGLLSIINSSNANGGYLVWNTSGTTIADIGTAQQCFGSGGNDTFAINGRGARSLVWGTNNTERMRLDSSGNLGIGTSSPTANTRLDIFAANRTTDTTGQLFVRTSDAQAIDVGGQLTLGGAYNATPSYYAFGGIAGRKENSTNNNVAGYLALLTTTSAGALTERARITSDGDFLVSKTTASASVVGFISLATGAVYTTMSSSANTESTLNVYSTGASAYRFYVGMGGTVYATNTTISAISDQRFKENVSDLDVGLDAVLALKPRKFDWKEGKGKDIKGDRGFIAQEFEQVFPDLVDEWRDPAPEGEEPYKSVRQDLIPVLVKAIQEQQAMIKSLEAKVAALESK